MRDVGAGLVPRGRRAWCRSPARRLHRPHGRAVSRVLGLAGRHRPDHDGAAAAVLRRRTTSPRELAVAEPARADRSGRRRAGGGSPTGRPALAEMAASCTTEPDAAHRPLAATPATFLHGDWKMGNLGSHPDGRTILLDWAYPGSGPACWDLCWYLALNRARLPEPKEAAIDRFRAALERHGVDHRRAGGTASWTSAWSASWPTFGWEKALGDAAELRWWEDRVVRAVERCGSTAQPVTVGVDQYAGLRARWARGAELVYGPSPRPWSRPARTGSAGRTVLDAGAGTGRRERGAQRVRGQRPGHRPVPRHARLAGAHPAAVRRRRHPCACPIGGRLGRRRGRRVRPQPSRSTPPPALAELAGSPGPAARSGRRVRQRQPQRGPRPHRRRRPLRQAGRRRLVSRDEGGRRADAWHGRRDGPVPRGPPGWRNVAADERPVDVGVTEPAQLVRYRLGHPAFAAGSTPSAPTAPRRSPRGPRARLATRWSPTGPVSSSFARLPPCARTLRR